MTADAQDETLARCLDAGANDYITKPFSFVGLNARITNVVKSFDHRKAQ